MIRRDFLRMGALVAVPLQLFRVETDTPAWAILNEILDYNESQLKAEVIYCSNKLLLQFRLDKSILLEEADDKIRGTKIVAMPGVDDSVVVQYSSGRETRRYRFDVRMFKHIKGFEKLLKDAR